VILIAFCFGAFLRGRLAGFGTPVEVSWPFSFSWAFAPLTASETIC